MAFESLHRYFDYTMHTRQRSYYQYALLHMAIMQADFGCYSEAAAAMTETIATARENQDLACMNFSLSWLQHLARAYPAQMNVVGDTALAAERYGLQYLKFKAKEMKLPSLLCSSLLTEAKMALSSVRAPAVGNSSNKAQGDSISTAFERLQQAAHVNVMYNMQNSYGIGLLLTGAAYGRLGERGIRNASLLIDRL
jgi:anaphase-promoting complex subunit 5